MLSVVAHRFSFEYAGQTIGFHIWRHDGDEPVSTIVFLGTVQVENLPRWAIEHCPPGTVVVEGAPHWYAAADGSDILAYMDAYTKRAYDVVEHTWHPRQPRLIADSQASPGVLRLLVERQSIRPSCVVLLQPLGLNSVSFGETQAQRFREFGRRVRYNARFQFKQLLVDSRLRYNHRMLVSKSKHLEY